MRFCVWKELELQQNCNTSSDLTQSVGADARLTHAADDRYPSVKIAHGVASSRCGSPKIGRLGQKIVGCNIQDQDLPARL